MLLLVVNAILISVFLKKFVISLVSLPMYVNLAHFVFWLVIFCYLHLSSLQISCWHSLMVCLRSY
jgi:hypothetical protein